MADTTTKEKIIKISTQGSEKNVKSLKTQIKELKEQLAQLEIGTEEFDRVSKLLADTNQKQIEINEAMAFSNKDIGATLSNLTKISSGVVGAISSINSVMSLMGVQSEDAQKAIMRIQALMAIIQGMSAIDTALKALKGLTVAYKDFNAVKAVNAVVTAGAATAEIAEAGALADNTVKMKANNEVAREYNELNEKGKTATDQSREAIDKETLALQANQAAKRGNTEEVKRYIAELEKLKAAESADISNAKNIGFGKAIDEYIRRINELKSQSFDGMDEDTKGIIGQKIKEYEDAANRLKTTSVATEKDIIVAAEGELAKFADYANSSFEDMEEGITTFSVLLKGLPYGEAEKQAEEASKVFQELIENFKNVGDTDAVEELTQLQQKLNSETAKTLRELLVREAQEEIYQQQITETTAAETANTAAMEANTAAKAKNTAATAENAAATATMGKAAAASEPMLKKLGSGISAIGKTIANFVKANPILAAISAAVALIGFIGKQIADMFAEAHKEAEELQKMANEIDMEFNRQFVDIKALLRMLEQENTTAYQKKVLTQEINKLAKEELVTRNEITGEWELSTEKIKEYIENLKNSIKLEYHKKKILELMDEQEEAENGAIYERNNLIGDLFETEQGYLDKARHLWFEQQKHWMEIDKLTATVVRNIKQQESASKTASSTVKKTFTDLYNELIELYKRLYKQITSANETKKIFDGIYTEASVAFDKIGDLIESNLFSKNIADGFNEALASGLKDIKPTEISLEFLFGDNFNNLEKLLSKEKGILKDMLQKTSISEKELLKQKTVVDNLEKELQAYQDITSAVMAYSKAVESARQADIERTEALAKYNVEQLANAKFVEKQRRENGRDFQYAELEKEIELNKNLLETTRLRLSEEKSRIDDLRASQLQNKATIEEIAELQKKIDEDQRTIDEARMAISNANWQMRLTQLDEEYAKIQRNSELEQMRLEIGRTQVGGGVADYNTETDLLKMQLDAMKEYAIYIDEFYNAQKEKYAENSQELLLLEQERLAAQEALQNEYYAKELEKEQAQANRKLAIQKAYINAYQSISGQISSVLGEVMNMYDENSKEYLSLKYAQGVTDTISGSLAAFMSGVESGIPAPYNFILGGVLSASTMAVGMMQLANLKKGSLQSMQSTSATTVDIGTEYDTLSYTHNSELMGAIQDQKVYVVESDITATQNRIRVAETQATF